MHTVTLGPAGTYSHRAAGAVATDDEIEFRESIRDIVNAVADGDAARGVVPIENSIEGSVTETLDALAERDVAVVREVITPIKHGLLAQSETFDTVASHPQALAQCREYLDEHYPDATIEAVASTARGVELAAEDPSVAGIGHPDNATGDLRVIAADIQDRRSNATRFFVLAPPEERTDAGGKSSFVVYPGANYPGLLLELLEPFAERGVNLTRVESRPSGEHLGDYLFHLDVDGGLFEERTQAALEEVEEIAENGWVRRLGSYDVEHVV
ncbi:prephenate dehydratase [Halarchaeum nitratireducens]|uniref:Prephenate dehydratase n=1 Tax=Halarchaeum nitratireducens TaxID=489913 RepID=A0A830G9M9_9EURY|nr:MULTISPECIES: prephenate dehydratase [Halarchaeum]MBP2250204.1 prephenate dehydratase [Halarchaeum solikamskense]GGN11927.1 prephenate dehydratase [Halarchaeum nitratireducens]